MSESESIKETNYLPPPPYPGKSSELDISLNWLKLPQFPAPNYPDHEQVRIPQGWGPYPPPPPQYHYGATTITLQPQLTESSGIPIYATRVLVIGNGCPYCQGGVLADSYDCLAIFLAIFFFPLGILCCLAMRQKRCTNCGATF